MFVAEVVVVNLHHRPHCAKPSRDDVLAHAPVDEKDRCHAARRRFSQRMASSTRSRRMP